MKRGAMLILAILLAAQGASALSQQVVNIAVGLFTAVVLVIFIIIVYRHQHNAAEILPPPLPFAGLEESSHIEIKNAIDSVKGKGKPKWHIIFRLKGALWKMDYDSDAKADSIENMISDARLALAELDLGKAKDIYLGIMNIYNKLSPEERRKAYLSIKELYNERKNLESLQLS